MTDSTKTVNYNLLDEQWIPVLWLDGKVSRVGIKEALTQANRIRQIAASNPMDRVAIFRFLLAILRWCQLQHTGSAGDNYQSPEAIPDNWLQTLSTRHDTFNLFHPTSPFLQDRSVAGIKENPATALLQELPSGTNISHFCHTSDFKSGLCLACCARALVRWSCYASAGTAGAGESMTAAPNGQTPTYAIAEGGNLLTTLLNEMQSLEEVKGDRTVWEDANESTSLGPLKGLTWRSRRILLIYDNEAASISGFDRCASCGKAPDESDPNPAKRKLIRRIHFRPGWARPPDGWPSDPHWLKPSAKTIRISGAGPRDPLESIVRQRRDLFEAMSGWKSGSYSVTTVGSSNELYKDAHSARVILSGPANNAADEFLTKLDRLLWNTVSARSIMRNAWQRPPKGHRIASAIADGRDNALCLALRSNLASLSSLYENLLNELLDKESRATQQFSSPVWNQVKQILASAVELAMRASTSGSPLRRRQAIRKALRAADEAVEQSANMPSEPTASKRRAKSGEGGKP